MNGASTRQADPQQVRACLARAESAAGAEPVEVIETHISWVFRVGPWAYKLKKPVRFEFLDFSTVELRRRACEEEVRLNRRLAPDVYVGMVALVADSDGTLAMEDVHDRPDSARPSSNDAIDYLIKMRRLADADSMQSRIAADTLTAEQIERVGTVLSEFFLKAAPIALDPAAYCAALEQHVRANLRELSRPEYGLDADATGRLCGAHLRYLLLRRDVLTARLCAGRVIEGHGDLRPEHIFIQGGDVVVIDCVEFSRELRTLDVADELSFLAMECDRLGNASAGSRLLEIYSQRSGDEPPAALIRFYQSYRAVVRAKVAALRGRQVAIEKQASNRAEVEQYLQLAQGYAREMLPPLLLVVRGLMGTGKTTLAQAAADALGLEWLATDAIRRQMQQPVGETRAYGEGVYSEKERRSVYDQLFVLAEARLTAGDSLVLDGTFLTNDLRERAIDLARNMGAQPLLVSCMCPSDIARQRIARRRQQGATLSDARVEFFETQQAEDELLAADLPHLTVDTTLSLDQQLASIIARLDVP